MADNYNINTTQAQSYIAGGLNPNDPTENVGDMMAKRSLEQQEHEQLVKQAIERTKQAKMQTGLDEKGGLEASKGLVPKEQAISDLKASLANSDVDDAKKAEILQEAQETWPEVVSADAVHRIVSALHEGKPSKMGSGKAFQADGSQKGPDGQPYAKGTYIEDNVDSKGNHFYVQSAQDVDKTAGKEAAGNEKQWQKLDMELNKFIRSTRGNSLVQAVQRSVRALNELNDKQTLSPQVLGYIQKDVSGIFQGGVPPVTGMDAEEFTTVYQKLNAFIQKYSGVTGFLHTDLGNQKEYITGLVNRLRDSTVAMLKTAIASEAPAYEALIHTEPDRWTRMVDAKMEHVTSGLVKHDNGNASPAPVAQAAPAAGGQAAHDPMGIL